MDELGETKLNDDSKEVVIIFKSSLGQKPTDLKRFGEIQSSEKDLRNRSALSNAFSRV